jgi:hypothetical protein
MPPEPPQGQGIAMLASIVGKMGGALGSLGGDLLGMKTSGDLFATVLTSRTVQDDLVNKFDLRRIYRAKRWIDARKELTSRTDISIDHKSGVLTIRVEDHDPQRARAIAQEYVDQLNNVVTQLNTSSAHREREFLEGRLQQVKIELESAEKEFSQFASSNATIDIKEQGKAMVEAAAALEGELIATETELQGLRQVYTDHNVRDPEASAAGSNVRGSLPENESGRDGVRDPYTTVRTGEGPGSQRNSKCESAGPRRRSREKSISTARAVDCVGHAGGLRAGSLLGIGQGQLGKDRSRGSWKNPCAEHGPQCAATAGVRGATTRQHIHTRKKIRFAVSRRRVTGRNEAVRRGLAGNFSWKRVGHMLPVSDGAKLCSEKGDGDEGIWRCRSKVSAKMRIEQPPRTRKIAGMPPIRDPITKKGLPSS